MGTKSSPKLPVPSVSVADNPKFAVVGSSPVFGSGIISWHCDEFSAYRNAKAVRISGGTATVEPVGDVDQFCAKNQDRVLQYLREM
jgi:hypothetical protein